MILHCKILINYNENMIIWENLVIKKICVIVLLAQFIAFGAVFDDELVKKALDSGLEPMPLGDDLIDLVGLNNVNKLQIELGKKLYFEPRISSTNTISCNSCHNLALAGADVNPTSIGNKCNAMRFNTPSVYNAVLNSVQFWDGRADNLINQTKEHITIMNINKESVSKKIASIPRYVVDFQKAYGNDIEITYELIANTIAIFENTLTTPSRYDDFLRGNIRALSRVEQEGLNIFIDKGCITCHTGINIGGIAQPFSVISKYKFANEVKSVSTNKLKIPSLRNILETAPYFHNGKYWNIKDVIKEMVESYMQISDDEVQKIETFFGALSGTKPNIQYPILPVLQQESFGVFEVK